MLSLIVGDGPLRQQLEKSARDLSIASRVAFSGRLPYESIGFAYQEADIFVMPTFLTTDLYQYLKQ